jgi:hypothetical protein
MTNDVPMPKQEILRQLHADRPPAPPYLVIGHTDRSMRAYGDARAAQAHNELAARCQALGVENARLREALKLAQNAEELGR